MKIRNDLRFVLCFAVAIFGANSSFAVPYRVSRLSPDSFNKMYYIASRGDVGVLREAISRGLYIDAVNRNDDTGLCVAIKRNNHVAYNSFRMSGANPRHRCTYRIQKQYDKFLNSGKIAKVDEVVGNKESLYYTDADRGFWPWIMAGGVIGAGAIALSGGGGSSHAPVDDGIVPTRPDEGVVTLLDNYIKNVKEGQKVTNEFEIKANSPFADVARKEIKFLPNMLDNINYMNTYVKVEDGGRFINDSYGGLVLGDRWLGTSGDGAIAISATGAKSEGINKGNIKVEAFNGAVGMASSNSAIVDNKKGGNIEIIFRGNKEGDAIIGMLADTHATATNSGTILGTTSDTEDDLNKTEEEENSSGSVLDDILNGSDTETGEEDSEEDEGEEKEEEKEEEKVLSKNSGTILGMALFDYYTGTNHSKGTVLAKNYGKIDLKAGYNGASEIGVSLIGMGSYIDDNFLKGNNNPSYAEKMELTNSGSINIAYQGQYTISEDALKLGDGGLIGMRADAQSVATNNGSIIVDMQATTLEKNVDVGAGMLSVHGGQLDNERTITMLNEATSGGISYGMLAAKGDGSQSSIYKWNAPILVNDGTINMNVSNSYAMASFAGGKVINNGEINLGLENGQSYYTNNVGLYAAGTDKTEEVELVNNGTINVHSELSSAIKSDYSGSVTMENNGTINVSNKATGAKVFDGNFSKAVNRGTINYKVDDSENFGYPNLGEDSDILPPLQVIPSMEGNADVVSVSLDDNKKKQYFENTETGKITIGATLKPTDDYGGTYGVSGVAVYNYGGAINNGTIVVENYSADRGIFNRGMYLASNTKAEAFLRNNGDIYVNGKHSVGMRSDSEQMADATNYEDIYVNGNESVGMAVINSNGVIYNGRVDKDVISDNLSFDIYDEEEKKYIVESDSMNSGVADIIVNGKNSVGMSIDQGVAYNYGNIYLVGEGSTAFHVLGEGARLYNIGKVHYNKDIKDLAIYWFLEGDKKFTFKKNEQDNDESGYIKIDDIILSRVSAGAVVTLTKESDVGMWIKGEKGRFAKIIDKGGEVINEGTIKVQSGAIGIETDLDRENDGAIITNTSYGTIEVDTATGDTATGDTATGDTDAIGIFARNEGVEVNNYGKITVNGENAIGIKANNYATVNNNATISIDVTNGGIGIYASDGDKDRWTTVNIGKYSSANVKGKEGLDSIGYKIVNGAKLVDDGVVSVSYGGIGTHIDRGEVEATSKVNVSGEGSLGYKVLSGKLNYKGQTSADKGMYVSGGATGMYNKGGSVTNEGDISVSGENSIGMKTINSGVTYNNGEITVNGEAIGMSGVGNTNSTKGIISVGDSSIGMYGSGTNTGTIDISGGTGVEVTGNFVNTGTISGSGTGVRVDAGANFEHKSGNIKINSGTGVYVSGTNANASISGNIEIAGGEGVYAESGGSATNYGEITVKGNATGMKAGAGGTVINEGTITVEASGSGMLADDGGTATNNGTIEFYSTKGGKCGDVGGNCVNLSEKEDEVKPATVAASDIVNISTGASFVNNGVFSLRGLDVNFDEMRDETSKYIVAENGKYEADTLKGEVWIGKDVVMNGFEDTYQKDEAFVGKNEGLVVGSQSYMFNAQSNTTDDVTDVELNRKKFEDLVEDKKVAEFLEINYGLHNNEKMFNALKSAETKEEFDTTKESETGEKFYANLPRENMAVLRGLNNQEQNRILNDGIIGTVVGADYYRTGKDGTDKLSGFDTDVYSAYIGYGEKINKNWSMGGTLKASYVDSSYNEAMSSRDNKVLMAFMPILYQNNNVKFLTMPSLGVGLGEYSRQAVSGKYDADTFELYYGLYNHAEYSIDVKVAELVTEAELNLQGVSMSSAKEDDGLKLKSNNSTSLEAGVGMKLRKHIKLAKERSLMLSLGTKYYHEFLDPYKRLSIGMNGSPVDMYQDGYDESKRRLRTSAEAIYKDGDFAVSAEIAHNAEEESSIEGGLGVRYNF